MIQDKHEGKIYLFLLFSENQRSEQRKFKE